MATSALALLIPIVLGLNFILIAPDMDTFFKDEQHMLAQVLTRIDGVLPSGRTPRHIHVPLSGGIHAPMNLWINHDQPVDSPQLTHKAAHSLSHRCWVWMQ